MVDREDEPAEQEDASTSSGMPDLSALTGGGAGEAGGGAVAALPGIASAASPGGMSPGGSAAGGLVQDTVQAGQAISAGDVHAATDATVSAAATGAGYYFGGEAGGQAGRIAAKIVSSTGASKAVPFIVLGIVASLVLPFFAVAGPIVGFAGMLSATASAVAASCLPNVGGSGSTPLENPTKEQVAAAIYAQVKGFGYGDAAAVIAIGDAFAEKGLTANLDPIDNTSSRGYFQQKQAWVPRGVAWSGKPACPEGTGCPEYTRDNAWGPDGWATNDPRTHPHQSPNLYILGAGVGSGAGWGGMDDATLPHQDYLMVNGISRSDQVDWDKAIAISYHIQRYPEWAMSSHLANMKAAFVYYEKIVKGETSVPAFVAPPPWLKERASSPLTRAVFDRYGSAPTTVSASVSSSSQDSTAIQASPVRDRPAPAPASRSTAGPSETADSAVPRNQTPPTPPTRGSPEPLASAAAPPPETVTGDGLTLIGDSVMVGMIGTNKPADTLFGGPVNRNAIGSISLWQVINSDTFTNEANQKADIAAWRQDISTGPSRILVELGTNDGSNAKNYDMIAKFMAMAGSRDVYWFAQHYSPSKPMQTALERAAGEYPNLHIIPVLDLMPGGTYQPATQEGAHPYQAYKPMWDRAMETITTNESGVSDGTDCAELTGGPDGPIDVNPGASDPYGQDSVAPAPGAGYSVNLPGGRNMTYYSQCDERWSIWQRNNFCACACGTTSMAMVIATLAPKADYTPPNAYVEQKALGGVYFNGSSYCGTAGGSDTFFRTMADKYGVPSWDINEDFDTARRVLQQGGLVTVSINQGTVLTPRGGHYIVLRGIAPDGKFLVADPGNRAFSISGGFRQSEFDWALNQGMVAFLPPGQVLR